MTDPIHAPKRLYRKAARGKDDESMPIVLGAVMPVVTLAVLILMTITCLVSFLAYRALEPGGPRGAAAAPGLVVRVPDRDRVRALVGVHARRTVVTGVPDHLPVEDD